MKLDSIRSRARKSVDLRRANDPRSCERGYGHSLDSEITFENRYSHTRTTSPSVFELERSGCFDHDSVMQDAFVAHDRMTGELGQGGIGELLPSAFTTDDERVALLKRETEGREKEIHPMRSSRRIATATIVGLLSFLPFHSEAARAKNIPSKPDFTQGDPIPQGATHDWNLGPTGARGWIYSNKMETSEARQIYVTTIEKESPSDGILQPGDVILGINGKNFAFDPRAELGKAIGAAEASDGKLAMIRWRKGTTSSVALQLPILGTYSATAPYDCRKSQRIFEQGCAALARKMRASPNERNGIVRSLNALALLASGRSEYLPLVREQVEWASNYSDPKRRSLHSWYYGPINILLAEYTMVTGDRSFVPDMKRITMEIVYGQSPVGSWGHRFVQSGGRLAGYGMMNAPGLPLTVSLILARQAGIDDPQLDEAIEKSARLIRFYVGKGSVPYGDHHPWIQTHEDNGKNGIAAVMFNLLGDTDATEYFSRMSVASHGAERDTGHTGNFFNMLWAMPGVALSGQNASGAWIHEFGWHYDLARRWDGTFQHQGPPAARSDSYRRWDSTGAYLLAYAQPLRQIHLTGKKHSKAEQIDASTAESLIVDGRDWSPRLKHAAYTQRSKEALITGLASWSPVVRERSAMALAEHKTVPLGKLITMLDDGDLHARLGACQAFIMLKKRGAPAVPALTNALVSDDLWLRIKAVEALASIGEAAISTVPQILTMLASVDTDRDPRGMQQRYLCFALFQNRTGMLRQSLEGVDRDALYLAIRAGLENEDGRARGALASVYKNLSYDEIEPLLPAIHQAVIEPAPSGIMFADGIRLSGLEILAKHRIEEGASLCLDIMGIDRWGKKNRITQCLKTLQLYGGAARPLLPRLEQFEAQLRAHKESKSLQQQIDLVNETKTVIETDEHPPTLRSLRGAL